MTKQIVFIVLLIITLGVFAYSIKRLFSFMKFTKPYAIKNYGKRFQIMMEVAFGQTKIFRLPIIGFIHALVFWGFCIILIGSVEIVIDGIAGAEKALSFLGIIYDFIMGSGDFFAFIIAIAIIIFLFRRLFLNIKRFNGKEMSHSNHMDANIALTIILLLMLSLLGANSAYYAINNEASLGVYPVSKYLASIFVNMNESSLYITEQAFWWMHIILIFVFANMLPYSKHFHVFLSVPNVFLTRLQPLGKLDTMESITKEVKLMMDPQAAYSAPATEQVIERFGVLDANDVTWKNYFDSLACTQCGRCTSVCPANLTGKMLSPRKVMMNLRERMNEKGPGLVKEGKDYNDGKSLYKNYLSSEEIWACTTCNACAQECPININHPSLIVDIRRYIVMEESAAPAEINSVFSNIENNGAPWQFSPEDRILWTQNITIDKNN